MDTDDRLSALLSSATLVALAGVFGSVLTVAERILVGRLLTPAAYGEVSVGLAVLAFGRTIALVGLSQGVPRFVSRFDEPADRRGVWASSLAIALVLSVLLAAIALVNVDSLVASLFERTDSPRLIALFLAALPFAAGLQVGVGAIRGHENTRYKVFTQDLLYPLLRMGLIGGLLLAGASVLAVGYAYLAAAAVAFVVAHLLLARLLPLFGPIRTHTRSLLSFSLPVVVAGLLSVLLTRTDTLMLAHFRSSAEVGFYSAAYPIANGMLVVLSAFGFLYLPLASRLDADDEHAEIDRIYQTTTKWIFLVTIPAFLVFVFFPVDVIGVFFGDEYAAGAPALVVLAVGFFANAIGGRNRETLSALGRTDVLMYTNGLAFALNLGLNVVLIPRYGLLGAAMASAVSFVGMNLAVNVVLYAWYDITPLSSASIRTFLAVPAGLAPVVALLGSHLRITVLTLVPTLALVGIGGLVVTALAGGFQPEDRIVIEAVEDAVGIRLPLVRRYVPTK